MVKTVEQSAVLPLLGWSWIEGFSGSYRTRTREQGVESMEENHLTWLVMRFSLDKKGGKADGLGEADGLKDWMSLKSGVRMSECKNVRKDLGTGLPCF